MKSKITSIAVLTVIAIICIMVMAKTAEVNNCFRTGREQGVNVRYTHTCQVEVGSAWVPMNMYLWVQETTK